MNDHAKSQSGVFALRKEAESDKDVIRLLREERVVVSFEDPEFDAYVKAPEGVVHEFIVLYSDNHADRQNPDQGWERTSIDPFTLKRELRRREFSIKSDDSQTPFSDQ